MFVCISPNPAIDKRLRVSRLTPGAVNRATETSFAAGGKAAHVAMVLKALKADPIWLGFVGGTSGEALLAGLSQLGIRVRPIAIQQTTRVNLEIIEDDGRVTEILEPGPALSLTEVEAFQNACEELFAAGGQCAHVILSGSLPPSVEDGFYATVVRQAHHQSCKVFLDTSRMPLRMALKEGPEFVKPNREETEWLMGTPIVDLPSAAAALRSLLSRGAKSAAISLGQDGLVWSPGGEEGVYYAQPPIVKMRSAVGSGDAVVAAFAHSMSVGLPPEETIRVAAACGAANCFAESPGAVKAADVLKLYDETRVSRIS